MQFNRTFLLHTAPGENPWFLKVILHKNYVVVLYKNSKFKLKYFVNDFEKQLWIYWFTWNVNISFIYKKDYRTVWNFNQNAECYISKCIPYFVSLSFLLKKVGKVWIPFCRIFLFVWIFSYFLHCFKKAFFKFPADKKSVEGNINKWNFRFGLKYSFNTWFKTFKRRFFKLFLLYVSYLFTNLFKNNLNKNLVLTV